MLLRNVWIAWSEYSQIARCSVIFCRGNECYALSLDPLLKTGTGMKLSRRTHFQCTACVDFTPSVEALSTGYYWSQDAGLNRSDPLMVCILTEDRDLHIWTSVCSASSTSPL